MKSLLRRAEVIRPSGTSPRLSRGNPLFVEGLCRSIHPSRAGRRDRLAFRQPPSRPFVARDCHADTICERHDPRRLAVDGAAKAEFDPLSTNTKCRHRNVEDVAAVLQRIGRQEVSKDMAANLHATALEVPWCRACRRGPRVECCPLPWWRSARRPPTARKAAALPARAAETGQRHGVSVETPEPPTFPARKPVFPFPPLRQPASPPAQPRRCPAARQAASGGLRPGPASGARPPPSSACSRRGSVSRPGVLFAESRPGSARAAREAGRSGRLAASPPLAAAQN